MYIQSQFYHVHFFLKMFDLYITLTSTNSGSSLGPNEGHHFHSYPLVGNSGIYPQVPDSSSLQES